MSGSLLTLATKLRVASDMTVAVNLLTANSHFLFGTSWANLTASGLAAILLELATSDATSPELPPMAVIGIHGVALSCLCYHIQAMTAGPADLLKKHVADLVRQSAKVLSSVGTSKDTLWRVRFQQIRILHALFIQSDANAVDLAPLPIHQVIDIVHDIYFSPSGATDPEMPEVAALQSGSYVYQLIAESNDGSGNVDAFRRTVARVGLDGVARRFLSVFSAELSPDCAVAACHLAMLAEACSILELTKALQLKEIHLALAQITWRLLYDTTSRTSECDHYSRTLIDTIAKMLATLSKAEGSATNNMMGGLALVQDLVMEQDLLLMLGKVLRAVKYRGPDDSAEEIMFQLEPLVLHLDALCRLDRKLKVEIERQWLHVLKGLKVLARPRSKETPQSIGDCTALRLWEKMGSKLGFQEKDIANQEAEVIHKLTGKSLKGCSWVRCPLYQGHYVVEGVMICSGCRVAQYCQLSCQELDWKEGGHRAWCKAQGTPVGLAGNKPTPLGK